MKVLFLGSKQAGLIGLLATLAHGCVVKGVVTTSEMVRRLAERLDLPIYHSVKQPEIKALLKDTDLMVSVHSREIIPLELLELPRMGGINVHPCLYAYKGADPVNRWLAGDDTQVSVGVHLMTEEVDCGDVIIELFEDIDRNEAKTAVDVYNILYPLYGEVLIRALGEYDYFEA